MSSSEASESLQSLHQQLDKYGLRLESDDHVTWDASNEDHPRNWGVWAKSYNNAIIFFLEFFMTFISASGVSISVLWYRKYISDITDFSSRFGPHGL